MAPIGHSRYSFYNYLLLCVKHLNLALSLAFISYAYIRKWACRLLQPAFASASSGRRACGSYSILLYNHACKRPRGWLNILQNAPKCASAQSYFQNFAGRARPRPPPKVGRYAAGLALPTLWGPPFIKS